MRSFLVGTNKARIAGDIGCNNGDELPFDLMHGYGVRRHGLSLRKGEEPYHGPCFLPKNFGAPASDRVSASLLGRYSGPRAWPSVGKSTRSGDCSSLSQ